MTKSPATSNSNRRVTDVQRGLTLIEIVITLLVLAIIAAFVGRPLINLIQSRVNVNETTTQQADVEYALTRIGDEIRFRAATPNDSFSCSGNEVVFNDKTPFSGYIMEEEEGELVTKPANDVLVKNIENFICTEIKSGAGGKAGTNLYEIELVSDSKNFKTRAYRRVAQ